MATALRFPLLYSVILVVLGMVMSGVFFYVSRLDPAEEVRERLSHELEEAAAEQAEDAEAKGDAAPKRLLSVASVGVASDVTSPVPGPDTPSISSAATPKDVELMRLASDATPTATPVEEATV